MRVSPKEFTDEVLDVGETADGSPFYTMPFMKGVTLSDRLARRSLSYNSAVDIACQFLEGLSAVHARRIIHRDLKSGNLFLVMDRPEKRYFVKILDFGVSKILGAAGRDAVTDTGMIVGTLKYMAPEQAAASRHIDMRVDVYAAGLILYELFTGAHPLSGLSFADFSPRLSRPIKPPRCICPALTESLEQVIMTALSYDPEYRFKDAAAMLDSLREALDSPDPERREPEECENEIVRKETALRIRRPKWSDLR